MHFLRPAALGRSAAFRPVLSTQRARPLVRYASQDYGSGAGNPAGEKPEQQGKNPSENLEHPGPPPPKVARGTKSSPNDKPSEAPTSQSGSSSEGKEASEASKSSGGSPGEKVSVKGAKPKILSENPPGEHDESVKQHNAEMDNRAEKAHEQISNKDAKNDKAPPGYWSGQGGRDSQP